jgi:hypothetical protein
MRLDPRLLNAIWLAIACMTIIVGLATLASLVVSTISAVHVLRGKAERRPLIVEAYLRPVGRHGTTANGGLVFAELAGTRSSRPTRGYVSSRSGAGQLAGAAYPTGEYRLLVLGRIPGTRPLPPAVSIPRVTGWPLHGKTTTT